MVPAGTIHTAWNAGSGDEQVHVLVDLRLGGVRSETPLETMFGLAHDGKTTKAGIPRNPLRLVLLVHDYENEMYLAQPPLWVQRMIFGGWPR